MAKDVGGRDVAAQSLAIVILLVALPAMVAASAPSSAVATAPAGDVVGPGGFSVRPAQIAPPLGGRLLALSRGTTPDATIGVVLELRNTAMSDAAADVWRKAGDRISLPFSAGRDESGAGAHDEIAALDKLLDDSKREVYARAERALRGVVAELRGAILGAGGEYLGFTPTLPAVFARTALSTVPVLADRLDIARISEDERMTAAMDVSPYAIFADDWWGGGYTGGTWDLAVVDTGIDGSHPALTVDFAGVFHAAGRFDPCYVDNTGTVDDLHGHGTHIAGTVTGTDTAYRGVAYGMDALINAKAGWLCSNGNSGMYWSDAMSAVDWAIQTGGADVVSFSFGGSPGAGDTAMARFFDAVTDDLGVVVAISAGNDGPGGRTVHEPATAYNAFTVANVNDANTVSRSDDAVYSSSSRGPTGDGRQKPDIAAPGTQIMSANADWETQADFVAWTGTSMATPHVAASVLLLMDERGLAFPAVYKALLLNTADDRGSPGPDSAYGWGYVNLRRAFQGRSDVLADVADDTATGYRLFAGPVPSDGKATLVWHRHATYAGANYPTTYYALNNLDLVAFNGSDGARVGVSASTRDNVEQVVTSAAHASVVYKVVAVSPFAGVAQERFALAVAPGVVAAMPPSLTSNISLPGTAELGTVFTVSSTVGNGGGLAAHDVQATLNLPPGATLVSGANPQDLGTIDPGSNAVASWQVSAAALGLQALSASASSMSYEEPFTAASGISSVDVVDTTPPNSSVDPLPAYRRTPAFTVTATASDPSPITAVGLSYRRDGGSWTSAGTDAGTPWSWAFDADASGGDGFYEFYTTATDAAGNVESAPAVADAHTTVDRLAPVSSYVVSGTEGEGGWFAGPLSVNLSATDAGSGVDRIEYDLDGGGWGTYGGPIDVSGDGVHTISFRALDLAGNAESPQSLTVRIDSLAPVVSIAEPAQDAIVHPSVTLRWTRTDAGSGIRGCTVAVDGQPPIPAGTSSTRELGGLGDGPHEVRVVCDDHAGNRGESLLRFRVDANPFSPTGPFGPWLLLGIAALVVAAVGIGAVFYWSRRRRAPPQ